MHRPTLVLGGLAAAALVGLIGLTKIVIGNPETLGQDLPAYVEAARRLIETGSPYSLEVVSGQLDRYDIATGYLYPPVLAQAFVPLSYVPMPILTVIWTAAQVALLIVLLPMVYARFGGHADRAHALTIVLAAVAFFPNLIAVVIGNVSGWIAIGAAVMLLAPPVGRSAMAAALMWVKLTPGAFVIGAFVDRSSRLSAIGGSLGILVVSFLVSPAAWTTWIEVFPTVSGFFGNVPFTSNLAPSHVLGSTGFPLLASIASVVVPAAFLGILIMAAARGLVAGWVAAGAGVYLTATGTAWDHYFAVLTPIAVAVWPGAPRSLRIGIVAVLVWLGPLRFLELQPAYQLVGLGLWLAALFAAALVLSNVSVSWRLRRTATSVPPPLGSEQ
jgi:alpha-1,2-mannosyltransferase